MRNLFLLFVFSFLCFWGTSLVTGQVSVKSIKGRVVRIIDGDTFDFLSGSTVYRIRLAGIDCPEKGQPFGSRAKEELGKWCAGKHLIVKYTLKDRNGRLIGDVYSSNNEWLNYQMVQTGFAWHFKKYSSSRQLAEAEVYARTKRVGLWKDPDPVAPWLWRSLHKSRKKSQGVTGKM